MTNYTKHIDEDMKKTELWYTAGGKVIGYNHLRKKFGSILS